MGNKLPLSNIGEAHREQGAPYKVQGFTCLDLLSVLFLAPYLHKALGFITSMFLPSAATCKRNREDQDDLILSPSLFLPPSSFFPSPSFSILC